MSEFVVAAKQSELKDGERILVEVEQQLVILFRVGNDYHCLDDVCTHDGGSLNDGDVDGYEIACPRHGAKFDIRCGKAMSMPATQATASHEVKIEGENIMVKLAKI